MFSNDIRIFFYKWIQSFVCCYENSRSPGSVVAKNEGRVMGILVKKISFPWMPVIISCDTFTTKFSPRVSRQLATQFHNLGFYLKLSLHKVQPNIIDLILWNLSFTCLLLIYYIAPRWVIYFVYVIIELRHSRSDVICIQLVRPWVIIYIYLFGEARLNSITWSLLLLLRLSFV